MLQSILIRRNRRGDLSDDPVVAYIRQHATEIGSGKDVARAQRSGLIQLTSARSLRQQLLPLRPLPIPLHHETWPF